MKTTEPYSPSALAKAKAKPVSSAGNTVGRITRQKVCQRLAPRLAAASSASPSNSSKAGCKVRTKLEQYDYAGATAIAVVMLLASFLLLLAINMLQWWAGQGRK